MSSNDDECLQPKDRKGSTSSGSDMDSSALPSRSASSQALSFLKDSPPMTPPPFPFGSPVSSFSTHGSPSGSPRVDHPQGHRKQTSSGSYTFPSSGTTPRSASVGDVTRRNVVGSRPTTAGAHSSRPSSTRVRESFTSPPMRPLTVYNPTARLSTRIQRERPKSTMLSEGAPLEKPWLTQRDPYARIAYFLTYGMLFLGVIAGAVQCYFSWNNTLLLPDNELCLVLNENFDSPDTVFATNGSGTFFREVDMSGFGYVLRPFLALWRTVTVHHPEMASSR